jgi:hypothetical protein
MGTPESDEGLRKEIIDALVLSPSMAKSPGRDTTIKDIPELVYAIYRKLLNKF